MNASAVSLADLRRAHRAMGLQTPFEAASPLLLTTLAVVARCALNKPPAPLPRTRALPAIDIKRLAAGDRD